jgi:hypothetical protein
MEPSDPLEAVQKIVGGVRSLFEFARAQVLQQMSRLLVMTRDQEIIGEMRELHCNLTLYVRIRELAVRAAHLETPAVKLRRGEDGEMQFDYDYPERGMHVDQYKVERGKTGVILTLRSPLGFDVRLVIPPNVSAPMREQLRLAELKCSPSEDHRR